jgi:hypothetical protein
MKCIYILILFVSCTKEIKEVEDRIIEPPPGAKINSILILGNSILRQPPKPDIGWNNDWGMAATVIDSDFVHLLTKEIYNRNPTVIVKFENIAQFESNHATYNFTQLKSLRYPDLLIMRISENVSDTNKFYRDYDSLIKYISPKNILITDGFWRGNLSNITIYSYAINNNLSFVNLTSLDKKEYKALGQFINPGVAVHPSNKGMYAIKEKIWKAIKGYFK